MPAPVRDAVADAGRRRGPVARGIRRPGAGARCRPVPGPGAYRLPRERGRHAPGSARFTGFARLPRPGERADDVGLLAHEVIAHAIQQSGGAAVQLFDGPHGALESEAHSVAGAVLAGRARVRGRTSGPVVQGLFDWARKGPSAAGSAISSAASAIADVGAALRDKILGFVKDWRPRCPATTCWRSS